MGAFSAGDWCVCENICMCAWSGDPVGVGWGRGEINRQSGQSINVIQGNIFHSRFSI